MEPTRPVLSSFLFLLGFVTHGQDEPRSFCITPNCEAGIYAIAATVDGGVLTFVAFDPWGRAIGMKTDSVGDVQWIKNSWRVGTDSVLRVTESGSWGDSAYFAIGSIWPTAVQYRPEFHLTRLDSEGQVVWSSRFQLSPQSGFGFEEMHAYVKGNMHLLICGYLQGGTIICAEVDEVGQLVWSRGYSPPGSAASFGYDVEAAVANGSFIVASRSGPSNWDPLVIRIDSLGDVLWTKRLPLGVGTWILSMCATSDGGYVIGGTTQDSVGIPSYPYLLKFNAQGDPLWWMNYAPPHFGQCEQIVEAANGDLIFHLQSTSSNCVVRTDPDGVPITTLSIDYFGDYWDVHVIDGDSASMRVSGRVSVSDPEWATSRLFHWRFGANGGLACRFALDSISHTSQTPPSPYSASTTSYSDTMDVTTLELFQVDQVFFEDDFCWLFTGVPETRSWVQLILRPSLVEKGGMVEVGLQQGTILELRMVDAMGSVVSSFRPEHDASVRITTEGLAPGMYLVQALTNTSALLSSRFVVE
ncbi:MAG: hypothetical protein ABI599_08500 [Flavobacteriales bacterium]